LRPLQDDHDEHTPGERHPPPQCLRRIIHKARPFLALCRAGQRAKVPLRRSAWRLNRTRRAAACLIKPREVAVSRIPDEKLCTQRDGPSNDVAIVGPRDVYGRRSRQTGDRPWERCPCGRAANDPGERTLSDSNPTSVKESAAAEEQHHEDDDEQSGRVHFLSCVFGERGPASSRPVNARDERRRFGASAVRITPTPTCRLTAVQGGVCSLLDTAINARSLTRVVRENPA
jgi:hypothetical protein